MKSAKMLQRTTSQLFLSLGGCSYREYVLYLTNYLLGQLTINIFVLFSILLLVLSFLPFISYELSTHDPLKVAVSPLIQINLVITMTNQLYK